ncbi:MAG: DUF2335 domain-containing protein [Acidobacteria bacterium]|nr:DUF2335 domain-containing protein [Acidobacteriota bacterium]
MSKRSRNEDTQIQRPHQQRAEIRLERSFSGPLPPPETLSRYNDVLPGAAERILAMAESQHHHRLTLESDVVNSNVSDQRLGVILGFIIAMTAISGGIYLAATGKPASGLTSIIAAMGSLVGTFVYGKQKQKKDLNDKKPQ